MDAAGEAFLEEAERVLLDPVVGGSGWQATYIQKRKTLMNHPIISRGFSRGFTLYHLFPERSNICNKQTNYWYYLSDGKTIFSETLEQHNIAKAKYLGR